MDNKTTPSNHTVDEITIKKIEVLHNQILAGQQESQSYNNTFISSTIICVILTASAGVISNIANESWQTELLYILYALPMMYFLMLYNLLKYTGFQMTLGNYRYRLEEKVNKLSNDDDLLNWESKTAKRSLGFVINNGVAEVVFFLPPIFFFFFIIKKIPPHDVILTNTITVVDKWWIDKVYIAQVSVCFLQGLSLLWKLGKKEKKEHDSKTSKTAV